MSGLLNKLKKNKTPDQLVAAMVEALDQGQDAQLAKRLSQIKFVLYGEEEREPDEARCAALRFLNGKGTHTITLLPHHLVVHTVMSCALPRTLETSAGAAKAGSFAAVVNNRAS